MSFYLQDECTLVRLTDSVDLSSFCCIEEDLNDYLKNEALNYSKDLMGVTYLFTLDNSPEKIVCFFSVSNDILNLHYAPKNKRNKINRGIPFQKQKLNHYPSVKIGRLGVDQSFGGKDVGPQMMDFIKNWFLVGNKTGCRFIIVDAYNKPKVLSYYERNQFDYLFDTEDIERQFIFPEVIVIPPNEQLVSRKLIVKANPEPLKTRFMYYDLMKTANKNKSK